MSFFLSTQESQYSKPVPSAGYMFRRNNLVTVFFVWLGFFTSSKKIGKNSVLFVLFLRID